jgi:putative nucleotidyltransferase with HDIG domain
MVAEALCADPSWRGLPKEDRLALWCAVLLHDIAKPRTLVRDGDRISNPGHAPKGAVMARRILWEAEVDPAVRERACGLIRFHMAPFHLVDREPGRARLALAAISFAAGCSLLAVHARADARGRVCADQDRVLLAVDLYSEMAREVGCLDCPYPFAGPGARVRFFVTAGRSSPDWEPYDPPTCRMTLMSGLPASGKSTWIAGSRSGLPVVSLDAIREAADIGPEGGQRGVVHAAREQARALLRAKADFVWDATNLSLDLRSSAVRLALDYGASVEIVSVEAPCSEIRRRNAEREEPVPAAAIDRMLARWQAPTLEESHSLLVCRSGHEAGLPFRRK